MHARRVAEEPKAAIGKKVANFTLKDYRGQSVSLDKAAKDKVVVLAFLGTECPLCKLYAPRLAELAKQYESQGRRVPGHRLEPPGRRDRNRLLCPRSTASSSRFSRI